jgi:hypothetical protein
LEQAGLLKIVDVQALGEAICSALEQAPLRPGQMPIELPGALRGALGRTCAILRDLLPRPR